MAEDNNKVPVCWSEGTTVYGADAYLTKSGLHKEMETIKVIRECETVEEARREVERRVKELLCSFRLGFRM